MMPVAKSLRSSVRGATESEPATVNRHLPDANSGRMPRSIHRHTQRLRALKPKRAIPRFTEAPRFARLREQSSRVPQAQAGILRMQARRFSLLTKDAKIFYFFPEFRFVSQGDDLEAEAPCKALFCSRKCWRSSIGAMRRCSGCRAFPRWTSFWLRVFAGESSVAVARSRKRAGGDTMHGTLRGASG